MEIDELKQRLPAFVRAHVGDDAVLREVTGTPGHAGFSYFFDVDAKGGVERYFLRLPPPNVKLEGTADVLRQVAALRALDGTAVPHAEVLWAGDDPQWFGRPYFVTPRLPGDSLRLGEGEWGRSLSQETRRWMAEQAMTALAGIHLLEWQGKLDYLGEPIDMEFDVTRWDRFWERAAEPDLLADAPKVRQLLLDRMPSQPRVGLFHGDFQWANLLYAPDGQLLAVIDWELVGLGATLNDLGWILCFNDPRGWAHDGAAGSGLMPGPDELQAMYVKAYGSDPGDIDWFKALAAYKFAIITGFNLMLHRRGKRHDPHWEDIAPSGKTLIDYALGLLA